VRLIYNDPSRHFGGQLDDPGHRLHHYTQVLETELAGLNDPEPVTADDVSNESPCCGAK
jgi:hypothetical protein